MIAFFNSCSHFILGLGSDVGGSLRIPAHFCGISALKPTMGRLIDRGRRKGVKGQVVGVYSYPGFMARRVEGVTIAMQVGCPFLLKFALSKNVFHFAFNL